MAAQAAARPEDLARFFMERGNAEDVEGLVALYEPNAILAFPSDKITVGREKIRQIQLDQPVEDRRDRRSPACRPRSRREPIRCPELRNLSLRSR